MTITPAIPDLKVHAAGTSITISGTKQPRTGYTVTLAGKLKDEFGQTLGGSESARSSSVIRDRVLPDRATWWSSIRWRPAARWISSRAATGR
ncbi:MAG: hypothetical protein IPQ07_44650 [Myxococcales bacterium]|nr:hypothetical protein [Myxococcales bacterium]